jgi:mRNA interferase MazF
VDYDRFEVVIVPFPFTDKAQVKRRPVLVLSSHRVFGKMAGHSVLAMITSAKNAPWPLDVLIADLSQAGLPAPSMVRMKLFTLDHRFIIAKSGMLASKDRKAVTKALEMLLDM